MDLGSVAALVMPLLAGLSNLRVALAAPARQFGDCAASLSFLPTGHSLLEDLLGAAGLVDLDAGLRDYSVLVCSDVLAAQDSSPFDLSWPRNSSGAREFPAVFCSLANGLSAHAGELHGGADRVGDWSDYGDSDSVCSDLLHF